LRTIEQGLIERTINVLKSLESGLLVVVLSAMILLAGFQVVARNFFDSGILWGDSLIRVLVLWLTFIGATIASRNDEHIRIDLLGRLFSDSWKKHTRRFANFFTCLVTGVFAWYSMQFVLLDYADGIVAFAGVPAWLCESVMPLGATIISLRYLLHTFRPP
jgi:TRAP-type C4-dicarboxylate transport system permease small subunit